MTRPSVEAPQVYPLIIGEKANCAVDMRGVLEDGEAIASVTGVVDSHANARTIADVARNSATLEVDGQDVPANQAVTFSANSTGLAATAVGKHILTATIVTNATVPQTRKRRVRIDVLA